MISTPDRQRAVEPVTETVADGGRYIASESTFYRVLREENPQQHRGRSKAPPPTPLNTHCATGPNQVGCWDVTWLPGPAKGILAGNPVSAGHHEVL